MLLRNESRVKHSIEIKLVFDDNTTKELEIHEGDCVKISYKRNGCLRYGTGIIRMIKPYIRKFRCRTIESAVISVDMSENNLARVDKIELDDIINIELICPCCMCPGETPELLPENKCRCGYEKCPCSSEETDEEVESDE